MLLLELLELQLSCLSSGELRGVGLGRLQVEGSLADLLEVDALCGFGGMRLREEGEGDGAFIGDLSLRILACGRGRHAGLKLLELL